MSISEKYLSVRNKIPSNVKILFACKYANDEQINELLQFDDLFFGENYVQSAKKRKVKIARERYHFIGRLQRNKVREALEYFGTVQTVDSKKLADKISKTAVELKISVDVYIQVNLDNDLNFEKKFKYLKNGEDFSNHEKHGGVKESELDGVISHVKSLPNMSLVGLMSIGTLKGDSRSVYKKLRKLADQFKLKTSMGMSGDYKIAIEEGSNIIRLGRILL